MYGLTDYGQNQFNTGIICGSIAGFAIVLRVLCKILHKQGLHLDDYWIIGSLIFYWTSIACVQWGLITGGGGLEMKELALLVVKHPEKQKLFENFLESAFLGFTFVTVAQYGVKISILLFYRRIFFVTTGYRRMSLVVIIFTTAWFIATQVANLLTCRPIDAFWHLQAGKCFNFSAMFLGTGIVDTLVDLVVLVLPIRMAFALQLPMRTKIAVAGIFALGGFVVITNIIRLKYIYNPNSRYVRFGETIRWLNIHMLTAFVCASLPVYKPLWNKLSQTAGNMIGHYASSIRSILKIDTNRSESTSYIGMNRLGSSGVSKEHGFNKGISASSDGKDKQTSSTVLSAREEDCEPLNVPNEGISYSRDVSVV